MARYFFDFQDGTSSYRDEDGDELASLEEAKFEAFQALSVMCRDQLAAGNPNTLSVNVRDGSGTVVLSTRVTMEVVKP